MEGEGKILRIFIGDEDVYHGKPLYMAIVERAREEGLAGATVLKGTAGFGATSRRIHTSHILSLSEDLPLVIEIIDREENIERILPVLDEMMHGGLITIEDVRIRTYRARSS